MFWQYARCCQHFGGAVAPLERGFAVAFSAELDTQNERTQALQALHGCSCMPSSTEAARHRPAEPSLTRSNHADLPTDAEVSKDRSGRNWRGRSRCRHPQCHPHESGRNRSVNLLALMPSGTARLTKSASSIKERHAVAMPAHRGDDLRTIWTQAGHCCPAVAPGVISPALARLYRARLLRLRHSRSWRA